MTVFQQNISTSLTARPTTPQVIIENPYDAISFVNMLEIVPDAEFTLKGKVVITINEITVFDNSNESNAFKQILRRKIEISNPELRKGSSGKIKFFVWNGTDSNTVELNFGMSLGESLHDSSSSLVPISKEIINREVSEGETLFTTNIYYLETLTSLLNLAGYKKFWVMMSASTIPPVTNPTTDSGLVRHPAIILRNSASGGYQKIFTTGQAKDVYLNDLDTYITSDFPYMSSQSFDQKIMKEFETIILDARYNMGRDDTAYNVKFTWTPTPDFGSGSLSSLKLGAGTRLIVEPWCAQRCFLRIEESDSLTGSYTLVRDYSTEEVSGSQNHNTTKRFVKLLIKIVVYRVYEYELSTNSSGTDDIDSRIEFSQTKTNANIVSSILDSLVSSGVASLSFEIKNQDGTWFEAIASSQFGTVTDGNSVTVQIGDTLTKRFNLPSTQTDFRGKLVITSGGIEVGVDILKVS